MSIIVEDKTVTGVAVIERMRELLGDGWCQRHLSKVDERGNMSYCLIGALDKITLGKDGPMSRSGREAAVKAITEEIAAEVTGNGVVEGGFAWWNDRHGRTKQDVLNMLDRAIRRVRS